MRLTLRTLLAYLDDMLEPAAAKEIGAKIAESGDASKLIRRIREVMRRRRLTAPEVSGPEMGIDPNLVAEYLDNLLEPEGVKQVEQVCLDSDTHLAEVAATHQILTLVLGEPIDIDPHSRERMYALGPSANTIETPAPAPATSTAAAAPTPTTQPGASQPFDSQVPEYLRANSSRGRTVWPTVAVVLVLATWLGFVFFDDAIFPKRDVDGDNVVAQTDPPPNKLDDATPGNPAPQPQPNGNRTVPNDEKPTVPVDPDPPAPNDPGLEGTPPIDDTPPVALPLPGDPVAAPENNGNSTTDGGSSSTPPEGEPVASLTPDKSQSDEGAMSADPKLDSEPTDPRPSTTLKNSPSIVYSSVEGIAFHTEPGTETWTILPKRSSVQEGESIAVPDPFHADLRVGDGQFDLTAIGGTRFSLLTPPAIDEEVPFGLEMQRGQLVIQPGSDRSSFQGPNAKPLPFRLRLGSRTYDVGIAAPDTALGIEMTPRILSQPDEVFGDAWFTARLVVASGAVTVSPVESDSQPLRVSSSAELMSVVFQPQNPDVPFSVEPVSGGLPLWVTDPTPNLSSSRTRIMTRYEKDFSLELSAAENTAPLVRQDSPQISEWAMGALVLIGDIRDVVKGLSQSGHTEARELAVTGIRQWLGQDASHADELTGMLKTNFDDEDAVIIGNLIAGLSEAEAEQKEPSARLVDHLDHPTPLIRELAFGQLAKYTGWKYGYQPMLPVRQRDAAVERIRDQLRKNDGVLVK